MCRNPVNPRIHIDNINKIHICYFVTHDLAHSMNIVSISSNTIKVIGGVGFSGFNAFVRRFFELLKMEKTCLVNKSGNLNTKKHTLCSESLCFDTD